MYPNSAWREGNFAQQFEFRDRKKQRSLLKITENPSSIGVKVFLWLGRSLRVGKDVVNTVPSTVEPPPPNSTDEIVFLTTSSEQLELW